MSTSTLVRDGVLRHGHPSRALGADPRKVQYHTASTFHKNDPLAHEREQSWTSPNWSTEGETRNYTDLELEDMLREAINAHDAAQAGRYYKERTWDARPEKTAPAPAASPAPRAIPANIPSLGGARPTTPVQSTDGTHHTHPDIDDTVNEVMELAIAASQAATEARDAHDAFAASYEVRNAGINQRFIDVEQAIHEADTRIRAIEESQARVITIERRDADGTQHTTKLGAQHKAFPDLLDIIDGLRGPDCNVWLAGPAGSGKTSAALMVARALGLPFGYVGAVDQPYKISGYMDANGRFVETEFYRRYRDGGIMLLDEVDGSSAGAVLELNAMLANSIASFPCGMVERHTNFICLGAGNTWGFGGDANYVGRNKLDAAFLDRFATLEWEYDEQLETAIAPIPEWTAIVQAIRANARRAEEQIVISPRASIKGGMMLARGKSPRLVVNAIFGRYRSIPSWSRIGEPAERFAQRESYIPELGTTIATEVEEAIDAARSNANAEARKLTVNFSKAQVFGR